MILSLGIGMLMGCSTGKNENTTSQNSQEANQQVETFRLSTHSKDRAVLLPGELLPYYTTEIFARVDGYVEEVRVDRGVEVTKGQVLAVLSAPELKAELSRAMASTHKSKAMMETARARYNRLLKASETEGAVAPNDLEVAKNQYEADSAAYLAAQNEQGAFRQIADFLVIRAPFAGKITERLTSPGELVGPKGSVKKPLFVLEDQQRLRLTVAVPEVEIANINHLDSVTFTLDAYPDKTFSGMFARRSNSLDPATRSESVEFEVDNSQYHLQANMYAQVELYVKRPITTFLVPKSALVMNTERLFVIRANQGKAEWIDVRQGNQLGEEVEVFGPLKEGDILLTNGDEEITPGMAVNI